MPRYPGADHVMTRPGFSEMLAYMLGNGARIVLCENASRFARDLAVQIAGHDLLKSKGISLIPVDAPNHFQDETLNSDDGSLDPRRCQPVRERGVSPKAAQGA